MSMSFKSNSDKYQCDWQIKKVKFSNQQTKIIIYLNKYLNKGFNKNIILLP